MTIKPERLMQALRNPAVWPDSPDHVECLETHISWVFLTRSSAWKIKKPVKFDFLDFSTLALRKQFCDEELRLNRRTAPDLYQRVVPICGSDIAPVIDGTGPPIEFALQMRRFNNAGLLSRLSAEKRLTPALIDTLAREIADFHAAIPTAGEDSGFGRADDIQQEALDNFTVLESLATGDDRHEATIRRLKAWTIAEGQRLQPVLSRRLTDGCVRECHGDLHLGNIVEIGGRTCLFDCIEFNGKLRWIDVISEVAFLVMDLEEHGEEQFARRLLNRYLELTGDYAGLDVLRYYLVYRAMVRAKIDMIRLNEHPLSTTQRRLLLNEFGTYLTIANHDSEQTSPALMIMHGLSGSGKTSMSQRIIENSPTIRIRSDIERKRLYDIAETERVSGDLAQQLYSATASERTYTRLATLARKVIEAGYSAVIDGAFLRANDRARFRELARRLQVPFRIVACVSSAEELLTRVASRAMGNQDASDAGVAVVQQQLQVDTGIDREPDHELILVDTGDEASVVKALLVVSGELAIKR